ncbi:MAG TPA: 3-hydroxyacyl-CoA dehydrogenase [Candidatus Bathyarchaeota archaeon]|nr:3-hydroxyacyl-CoA dehydrogenase [Candidatus Bathyarchaeota archaeon]
MGEMGASQVRKIVVVGAGTMGHGIAQVCAMSGYDVVLIDIKQEILDKAMERIKWSLDKFVQKRRIRPEHAEAALARIKPTITYEGFVEDADFAIEAVVERMDIKKIVFSKLDNLMPEHAILTSNTSSLSITELGRATNRPDKVAGMHFFNPPQLMQLVEVIKGEDTSDETVQAVMELARALGKTPVLCRKDVRGFIVNRVLMPVLLDAFWALHKGEVDKEGVDASMKYDAGFPMGIFELADYIGLDVIYEVGKVMHEAYGARAEPCPIVEELVKAGKLGQKSGAGFYDWSAGRPRIPFEKVGEWDTERSWSVAINEAAWLVHEDVAEPRDIDTAMKLGTGWPQGPCEKADKMGLDKVLNKLKELHAKYGLELYRPCPLLEEYVARGWTGKRAGRGFYTW